MMSTQSNAIPDNPLQAQAAVPAIIPESRLLYWSVLREVWENRSLYIAPMAAAALFLLGFSVGVFRLPGKMRAAMALDPMQQQALIDQPYDFAALLLMGTTLVVAVFYCLEALYGERRDRSILFWKSLPVSDLTTVLSKASIPLIVLPLLTFAITVATQWIMLLLSTAVLFGHGLSAAGLWTRVPMTWPGLLYHLMAVHGLYYAPFYGWLLLVSAWARRAPFLWAGLPLLAIGFVEKIAFSTSHFAGMLASRMGGGPDAAPYPMPTGAMHSMVHPSAFQFWVSPGLWIGLLVFAAFLAGAVRLRRHQSPI